MFDDVLLGTSADCSTTSRVEKCSWKLFAYFLLLVSTNTTVPYRYEYLYFVLYCALCCQLLH